MVSQLLGIHFDDGLRMPHFVNGRLLTADDLASEQNAMLTRLRLLGQATGHGVGDGLVVGPAAGANNLTISGGFGVARSGDVIRLGDKGVQISLAIPPGPKEFGNDAGRFTDCGVTPTGNGISAGAFLLIVRPISRLEESAPVKAMRGNLSTCESKWEVDGLEFRAIRLTQFTSVDNLTQRNLLAHWCFGSEGLKRLPANPFEFELKDFLQIHPANLADLTDCDLPLAVFTWTAQGLDVLDTWAARRRIVRNDPTATWDACVSETRIAEAQARFLQFQEHLENIRASDKPSTVAATKYFRYLPPVGFLPIAMPTKVVAETARRTLTMFFAMVKATDNVQALIASGDLAEAELDEHLASMVTQMSKPLTTMATPYFAGVNGFNLKTFFGAQMPDRYGLVDRETVDFRLNRSWHDEVIDLQSGTPFDILLVEETLYRTTRAILFLLLEGDQIQQRGRRLLRGSASQRLDNLIPSLWQQTDLRQRFFAGIAGDPAAAVQELAEGKPALGYAMFIKRINPIEWVALGDEREVARRDVRLATMDSDAAFGILNRIGVATGVTIVERRVAAPTAIAAPAGASATKSRAKRRRTGPHTP